MKSPSRPTNKQLNLDLTRAIILARQSDQPSTLSVKSLWVEKLVHRSPKSIIPFKDKHLASIKRSTIHSFKLNDLDKYTVIMHEGVAYLQEG